ncbi:hypothetical protein HGP17_15175 [Rhizobium sp. P38BS-XIX]|uniref:hypothetical protein n=1 Tax=Rhizobium sp. P38BS-XIX TaxID=2726740 RepID=UPI00145635D7|nr:hypothetical protein [Rhizobium sp. P38BS-XIX]NLR98155.1 hypothetical protein [Rhizobium sp. P38BS-XIX]
MGDEQEKERCTYAISARQRAALQITARRLVASIEMNGWLARIRQGGNLWNIAFCSFAYGNFDAAKANTFIRNVRNANVENFGELAKRPRDQFVRRKGSVLWQIIYRYGFVRLHNRKPSAGRQL